MKKRTTGRDATEREVREAERVLGQLDEANRPDPIVVGGVPDAEESSRRSLKSFPSKVASRTP